MKKILKGELIMKKILNRELNMQVVNIKHFVSDGDLSSGRSARASRDIYIYIGRATSERPASPLANPFPMRHESDRDASVAKYRVWLWNQMQIPSSPALAELNRIRQLARVGCINLLCWCAPKKCHGEIIIAAIKYLEGVKGESIMNYSKVTYIEMDCDVLSIQYVCLRDGWHQVVEGDVKKRPSADFKPGNLATKTGTYRDGYLYLAGEKIKG